MNIQRITQLSTKQNDTVKTSNNMYVGNQIKPRLTADTVSFTAKIVADFDARTYAVDLTKIKGNKNKPKFSIQTATAIAQHVAQHPEKAESISYIAKQPQVRGKDVVKMMEVDAKQLNVVKDISGKKDLNGVPKFDGASLVRVAKMPLKESTRIGDLAQTALTAESIMQVVDIKDLDTKKAAKTILDVQKACGDDLVEVNFKRNIYDPENAYSVEGYLNDDTTKSVLLDKKLNKQAVEETRIYETDTEVYEVRKVNDYRNNTVSKIRNTVDEMGYPATTHQVRICKDNNGKVVKTEYMQPSNVQGVFDIKYVYANGKTEQISSGNIDEKTGIVTVKRNMESLDGTKTNYAYEDDPQGNRIIDYKITDKDGKELLKYSQTFEVVSDNKFISSKNDKSYEITLDGNTLNVKDLQTSKNNKINLRKFIQGDRASMIKLLKQIPGEELIALKNTTKVLNGVEDINESCMEPDVKRINITNDLYSLLHELGHAKDFGAVDHIMTGKKDVQETFNKEKELYLKEFPNAQRDHINYFMDITEHYSGELGGLEETVAESNALLNSYNGEKDIAVRAQYLQQYFPKTIAKLAEHLYK